MFRTINIDKIKIFGLTAVFAVLVFFGSLFFVSRAAAKIIKAPNFNLRVLNSGASGYTRFSLKNFKGHVVIINFWATWCPPCRAEIPMIEKFYKAEHRSKGFIVVGVNVNNSLAGVSSFVKNYRMTYPVVYANSTIISNYGGINEIPQTFFISKSGRIMFHLVGEMSRGELYGIADKLLKVN